MNSEDLYSHFLGIMEWINREGEENIANRFETVCRCLFPNIADDEKELPDYLIPSFCNEFNLSAKTEKDIPSIRRILQLVKWLTREIEKYEYKDIPPTIKESLRNLSKPTFRKDFKHFYEPE